MPRSPLLFVFLCTTVLSAGDLKISSRSNYARGETFVIQYWRGERSRTDIQFAKKQQRTTIYQCDLHRMIRIDPEAREYTITEIRTGHPSGWSYMKVPQPKPGGAKVALSWDSRDTGERKQILGRTARHIVTTQKPIDGAGTGLENYEEVTDGWYIDFQTPSTACFPRCANSAATAVLSSGSVGNYEIQRTGVTDRGYPVWQRHTWSGLPPSGGGSTTHEVTELSEQPLDSALFEIPAGFKEVGRLAGDPPLPLTLTLQRRWERFKEALAQWF